MPRDPFPHLNGCLNNLSPINGKGLCFHRSAALCLDLKGSEVCMGTFRAASEEEQKMIPGASTVPFIHCWVEYEGDVLAPTTIERCDGQLVRMDRDNYYAMNGVRDIYRLTRTQVLMAFAGTGLSSHFKRGTPLKDAAGERVIVGDRLLTWAGVPHEIEPLGGVVPPGFSHAT